jgi:hypothetical protein
VQLSDNCDDELRPFSASTGTLKALDPATDFLFAEAKVPFRPTLFHHTPYRHTRSPAARNLKARAYQAAKLAKSLRILLSSSVSIDDILALPDACPEGKPLRNLGGGRGIYTCIGVHKRMGKRGIYLGHSKHLENRLQEHIMKTRHSSKAQQHFPHILAASDKEGELEWDVHWRILMMFDDEIKNGAAYTHFCEVSAILAFGTMDFSPTSPEVEAWIKGHASYGHLLENEDFVPRNRKFPTLEFWPYSRTNARKQCVHHLRRHTLYWHFVKLAESYNGDFDVTLQWNECYVRVYIVHRNTGSECLPFLPAERSDLDAQREFPDANLKPERGKYYGIKMDTLYHFVRTGGHGMWLCDYRVRHFRANEELQPDRNVGSSYQFKTPEMP